MVPGGFEPHGNPCQGSPNSTLGTGPLAFRSSIRKAWAPHLARIRKKAPTTPWDGQQATHFGMEACEDDATYPFKSLRPLHKMLQISLLCCTKTAQSSSCSSHSSRAHLLPETRRSATTTPNSPTRPCEIQFFWAPTWQQNDHTSQGGSLRWWYDSWMSFLRFKPISGRWWLLGWQHYWN